MKNSIVIALVALSLSACETLIDRTPPGQRIVENPADVSVTSQAPTSLDYTIQGVTGSEIGTLNLRNGPNGLLMRVELSAGALTPGWHGLHLHQVGDCSDTGTYKLSGGHVGKVEGGHGLLNPVGPEGGDTPNIFAHGNGAAGMEFATTLTTLAELRDEDGSALIIHAGPDDHITQPIGGAGARVACAIID